MDKIKYCMKCGRYDCKCDTTSNWIVRNCAICGQDPCTCPGDIYEDKVDVSPPYTVGYISVVDTNFHRDLLMKVLGMLAMEVEYADIKQYIENELGLNVPYKMTWTNTKEDLSHD